MGAAVEFAAAVRRLGVEARALGLAVPGFRSPPAVAGVDRTLRRRAGGPPAVAVRLAGRSIDQVLADMVEGVVVANGLRGPEADETRRRLLATVRRERAA